MRDNKVIYIPVPTGLKLLCELVDVDVYENSSLECMKFAIDNIKRNYYDITYSGINNGNVSDLLIRLIGYDRLEKSNLDVIKYNFHKHMELLIKELTSKISYEDFNHMMYVGDIDPTEVQLVVVKEH